MTYFKRIRLDLSISTINTVKAEKRLHQWPKFCPLLRAFGNKLK